MVLKQQSRPPEQGAPNRCYHATIPIASKSRLTTPRLVANAALLLPVTLAQHLGLREVVDSHVDLGDAAGGGRTRETSC